MHIRKLPQAGKEPPRGLEGTVLSDHTGLIIVSVPPATLENLIIHGPLG